MGINYSQYHACQAVTRAKEMALGNRQDRENPFEWLKVVIFFPGTPNYNCCWPWVYKERSDGSIAANLFVYVYDGHPIGPTE